jgi:hypothetical protein
MSTRSKVLGVGSLVSLALLLAVLVSGLVSAAPPGTPPGLDRAIAAQERHTDALLAKADVVGTAVGLAVDGQPVVKIYTKSASAHGLPADLDGVPVEVEQTGELVAQQATWPGIGGSSGTERLISVRGSLYCTVGTLGMLLTDGSNTYALSNAHVYANVGSKTYGGPVKTGAAGDRILQPGRVDMTDQACGTQSEIDNAVIGNLWAYTSITFSRTASNQVDAAIAMLSPAGMAKVANNTFDTFGTPSTQTADATLVPPMAVKKYGRTTGLTESTVSAINATVLIRYDAGVARFIGQVVVGGPFSDSGDSGSLIMTVDGNHPIALLFAGSSSTTIGNPIKAVLARFGLTIVGGP